MENMLARARAFAEPLIADETLDTGENTLAHADAVAAIVAHMGGSEAMQAASYLVYSCQHLNRPQEVIAKVFGDNFAALAVETTKLVQVQAQARGAALGAHGADGGGAQTENVRKMLLAFSRDLRVVMLRLASRLQTLRHAAAIKTPVPESVARESLQVFAPLANRLGIWQVKWEIEDLSFRFLEPETYKLIAQLLDEKRVEREGYIEAVAHAARRRAERAGHRGHRAGPAEEHLQHREEDAGQVARLRAGLRHPGAAGRRAGREGLLRRAGLGAFALRADRRGVRRLHRAA